MYFAILTYIENFKQLSPKRNVNFIVRPVHNGIHWVKQFATILTLQIT